MPHRPEDLIRRLARRYCAVLVVVAGLLVIDQVVLQPLLVHLNLSAPVINLAGRQRMLSQSIVKDALTIALDPARAGSIAPRLTDTLAEWRRVHSGLRAGDSSLGLVASSDAAITESLARVDDEVAGMTTAVSTIISNAETASQAIPHLLASERRFLPEMDRIVQLYEKDAQTQVSRLRRTALVGTALVIALMAGLFWLVLRPAIHLIRMQVDHLSQHEQELIAARDLLEERVEERTRQLSESVRSLAEAAEERAASEQRTLQLQEQLARASRLNSLGELATGIAHEINQPLGAIANYAETLLLLNEQATLDRDELSSTSTRLCDAAQRAGQIVRRMRNFVRSRRESRSSELINPLITDVVALCEPDLRSRRICVTLEDDETLMIQAEIDQIQIQQVLVNLIRNAAQSLESRSNLREITITTRLGASAIQISVDDNGPGFEDDSSGFPAPFHSTKPEGLGLGLSISRSIVEAHGGRLTVENLTQGGARVVVTLPRSAIVEASEPADSLCCR